LEFLEEDGNDLIDNFDVVSESVNFLHVELSVLFEFNLGLFNGSNRSLPGGEGLGFHVLGKDDIVLELGGISGVSVELNLEDVGLFLGFLDEHDGISTGSDLSLDEVIHGSFEMDNELIKSDHEFTDDGGLGIVSGGNLVLKDLGLSSVIDVIVTDFFSSGSSLIVVITFSKGEEVGESLLFEEMGVSGELVE
jgi:hypothetical protein